MPFLNRTRVHTLPSLRRSVVRFLDAEISQSVPATPQLERRPDDASGMEVQRQHLADRETGGTSPTLRKTRRSAGKDFEDRVVGVLRVNHRYVQLKDSDLLRKKILRLPCSPLHLERVYSSRTESGFPS